MTPKYKVAYGVNRKVFFTVLKWGMRQRTVTVVGRIAVSTFNKTRFGQKRKCVV